MIPPELNVILPYQEANVLHKGCQYSMAVPVEAGPTTHPTPEQDAYIACLALVVPEILRQGNKIIGKKIVPKWRVVYTPRGTECEMSPHPSCRTCRVAEARRTLEKVKPWNIYFPADEVTLAKINVDPLKGPLTIPSNKA